MATTGRGGRNLISSNWKVLAIGLAFLSAACSGSAPPQEPVQAASGGGEGYKTLGRYHIQPQNLPAPYATKSTAAPPEVIPRPAGAQLVMPPGFTIQTYAEGELEMPRELALASNGDVFVADSSSGRIVILRDENHDGRADRRFVFASGLNQPYGMAFWKDFFYVGNTDAVVRFKYKPGQTRAEGAPEQIASLPGRGYRQHWTRNLLFNPDGSKLYVTVGSETNVDVEKHPMRAAISEFNPDGTGFRVFARGTRNPLGVAFYPGTNTLWAAVQERDLLGDDLVPDYVTEVKEGAFYGWPFAYTGRAVDPRHQGERPDLVAKAVDPDVLIQAHSAVMDLVFYTGSMFPAEYRGDAFMALHGSWNRSKRTGYKIVRVRFKDGRPLGGYEDFLVGWMIDPQSREVWGRPVGLLVLSDGSLLISDDGANKIWRVSYSAPDGSTAR